MQSRLSFFAVDCRDEKSHMKYLIDGYNLLHALGLLRARAGPGDLLRARLGLLRFLRSALGDEASSATVIFDADRAPAGLPDTEDYEGIHIRYAVHEPEADDLIEDIIRQQALPHDLAVVSDDHRLQRAAQRRNCKALGCGDFLDWLEQRQKRAQPVPPQPGGKPQTVSAAELRHWLAEFGDLQHDPNLKALSEPEEWQEIDSL
jgi:uncharacterized protein